MVYYVYYNQYTWVEFHLLYKPNQQKDVPFFHLSMWHCIHHFEAATAARKRWNWPCNLANKWARQARSVSRKKYADTLMGGWE